MIRTVVQSLQNVGSKFLYPYKTIAPTLKRFESNEKLKNTSNTENNKWEELKRYRQAEVLNQRN